MITDNNIEKNSRYWCVLADQNVQTLLDNLVSKYNESKENLNEAGTPRTRTPTRTPRTPTRTPRTPTRTPRTPTRTPRTRVQLKPNVFSQVFRSKVTGMGLKIGSASILAGAGLAASGYLTAEGAEKVRQAFCGKTVEEQVDFIKKLLNSPDPGDQQMGEILKSQFVQNGGHLPNDGMPSGWSLDGFKDVLKTAGITVACVGAAYALWQCRGMISSLFSSSEKSSSKKVSTSSQAAPEPQGQTVSLDGELIAKCEFTADSQQLAASIDTDTCKWSLAYQDQSSGTLSDEDVKSYFKTKHFKNLTKRCYEFMNKYVGTEAFEKIAEEIQHANVPDDAKSFFKEIASNRSKLLSNLRSGAYNS